MIDISKVLDFIEVNEIEIDSELLESVKFNNTASYNELQIILEAIIDTIGDMNTNIIKPFEAIIKAYQDKLIEASDAYAELEQKINEGTLEQPESDDFYIESLKDEIDKLTKDNKQKAEELEKIGYELYTLQIENQKLADVNEKLQALSAEFNKLCGQRDILFLIIENMLNKN